MLIVLVVAVPVIVGLALLVAVLLQRAGFGLFVWALLPFLVSMALIGGLGLLLGRAATSSTPDERRSGGGDGV